MKLTKKKQILKTIVDDMSTCLPLEPSSELALANYPPNAPLKPLTQNIGAIFHCCGFSLSRYHLHYANKEMRPMG